MVFLIPSFVIPDKCEDLEKDCKGFQEKRASATGLEKEVVCFTDRTMMMKCPKFCHLCGGTTFVFFSI